MWADNEDFQEIMISPSMALDHFPDRVCVCIEGVARGWGIEVVPGSNRAVFSNGSEDRGGGSPQAHDALLNRV